ncbi:MAG: hypothetical protein ACOCV1_04100 [Bacillota bacterium]
MVNIQLFEDKYLPEKMTPDAAAYDCRARKIVHHNDGRVEAFLGFKTEIPKGWKGKLLARSNICKHSWELANGEGLIDCDFRGEWRAFFRPVPYFVGGFIMVNIQPFPYEEDERVCQIFFERDENLSLNVVNKVSETIRGDDGFGTSGNK